MFLIHTSPDHAETLAGAVVAACRGEGWASALQPRLLHTLFNHLLSRDLDFDALAPLRPDDVAAVLKSPQERLELVQLMCALEVLCKPVPEAMQSGIEDWATALGVAEPSLLFLRDLAAGETAKATHDFYRSNWIGDLDRTHPDIEALIARLGDSALAQTLIEDPGLSARWRALGDCPTDSLGRRLSEFYRARGFLLPGQVGGANESVAQHDWVHVLADYGTTPLGEVEVVSFQASCSRTPGATMGLIGALGLFESGAFSGSLIAGTHEHQSLSLPGGMERMAEAMERGKACNTDVLGFDFFTVADQPIDTVRSRFGIPAKSAAVLALDPVGAGTPR